jgi:hypothetical protein
MQGCVTGDFTAYRGNFHAHTSFSDGEGEPADAFAMARDQAGLDVQILTDHHEQLWIPSLDHLDKLGDCRDAAASATQDGSFVADCGFEWAGFSGISSTGHNNVFFAPALFSLSMLDFHEFYAALSGCVECVGQFNHPGSDAGQTWNSFEPDAAADVRLALFEFNGEGPVWDLLFDALDQGWHVSPMWNQDNHSANWGIANDHRSGLFMSALTRAAVAEAMMARRTFASADRNALVRTMAADQCWMGSRLAGVSSVTIDAHAEDPDAGDGFATLELYGPGQALLESADCGGATSCDASTTVGVAGPSYVVARAVQSDGDFLVSAPIWLAP